MTLQTSYIHVCVRVIFHFHANSLIYDCIFEQYLIHINYMDMRAIKRNPIVLYFHKITQILCVAMVSVFWLLGKRLIVVCRLLVVFN